jgi:hypothetical protein
VSTGFASTAAQAVSYSTLGGTPDPTQCSQPNLGQPYLANGDWNYYSPAPGPSGTAFDGSSWSFYGGAKTVSTQLADGSTGQALDMPAGSTAVSPAVCVIPSNDPMDRAMVRSLVGNANIQVSLSFYVPGSGWTNPQGAGNLKPQGTAWTLSNPSPLPNPPGASNTNSWQVVRFVFAGGGGTSDSQFYGLGVSALPPPPSTGPCSDPVLTQAFLPANDLNYYTQAPDFSAWTLTNGAQVKPATLGDDSRGQVLDLPAGSMAVSPSICVTSAYPTARMMIRSLNGGDDMSFRVSYANTNTWTNPHETGHVHGNLANWTLSDSVHLQPGNVAGWQIVRLALVPNGGHSEFQVYDLQLDPYAKG